VQPTDRLHALDAVRAYALLLGVVLHAAVPFLANVEVSMWRDEPHAGAAVLYFVIHMFRMSAFFLMAGLFGRMLLERRGATGFVKDRLKRVAVPLFLFGPVVLLLALAGWVLGALPHGGLNLSSTFEEAAAAPQGERAGRVDIAHLWFLYYLLIFYAVALAVRAAVRAVDASGSMRAACDRVVAFVMRGIWAPVLIALPIAAYLWQQPNWNEWDLPVALLPMSSAALVVYGVPFGLGWLLHRQLPLLLGLQRIWLAYLIAALALTVLSLAILGVTPRWAGPILAGAERSVFTAAYAVGQWCWVLALVGAALRFLSKPHPATRYLADASYWVYLMHFATISFFIALIRPFEWHWIFKLAIMIGGSMLLLLPSYHYFVRFTWIGAILNGRRHARPAKSPPVDAAPAAG
jgi:peptidoglycan/LPS O-acetylase OafA/YrhL